MKIVIDARELRTSSGRYVERLLHYLQNINQHDYIILLKPEDMAGWQPHNPRFKKVACPYKQFTFSEQWGLMRQIRSLQADLVHFPFVQQPILYRRKVVTTMQDLTTIRFRNPSKNIIVFTLKQQVYKWLNKRVAHKSARIITPTKFVKRDVIRFTKIKPSKVTVTYEAADKIAERPVPLLALTNKQFIMYVGRPMTHKNLDRLVAAFQIIKQTNPDLTLVLAGKMDANFKRLQHKTEKQVQDVYFTDFITDAELRWLYENARAYVFPSLSEGFGLPGLEAMVHGCPVVSSNATCLPEVYQDGAAYFDPKSTNDMANQINRVLSDPKLRASLVIKGSLVVKNYSWQRMAEQTLQVYNEV